MNHLDQANTTALFIILGLALLLAASWWVLFLSVRRGVYYQRDIGELTGQRDQLVAQLHELQQLVPPDNRRGRRRAEAILASREQRKLRRFS